MRPVRFFLAALGGSAGVCAVLVCLAVGDPGLATWVLVAPTPFYAVGLLVALRRPEHAMGGWLLAAGALSVSEVCVGDAILPLLSDSAPARVIALIRHAVAVASVPVGVAMFGLFPSGRIERRGERVTVWAVAALGVVLTIGYLLSQPYLPQRMIDAIDPAEGLTLGNPLFLAAAAPVGSLFGRALAAYPLTVLVGVVMLYLRYRRSGTEVRRRIRWLLLGMSSGAVVWAAMMWLYFGAGLGLIGSRVAVVVLWPLVLVLVLGSFVVAFSADGVFGIDRPLRRRLAYRLLWLLISTLGMLTAAVVGVLAAGYLPVAAAVLVAVLAVTALRPLQRRLERLADRWVFGARLDGYTVLARFGAALEFAPEPAQLLDRLAEAVRTGLGVQWARVTVDGPAAGSTGGVRDATAAEPALVVPVLYAGVPLGSIECGPRPDGELLDEDRRLLGHLAGQAAAALRNLQLTAELTAQLATIREQAAALAASRTRMTAARDAERQRIQRDLHDGIQQDIVVLTATLAMARQQWQRGDPRTENTLADLQRNLTGLLNTVRDVAHAIHPPVLADQGLLQAVEAHAARLPLEVVITADPALRGVRYLPQVEAAAWYVLAEALTNVIKHAHARRVSVALRQPDGRLLLEVRDDGRGFDPAAGGGLGLAGLTDRVSVAGGEVRLDSAPGRGTTLCVEIPLNPEVTGDG